MTHATISSKIATARIRAAFRHHPVCRARPDLNLRKCSSSPMGVTGSAALPGISVRWFLTILRSGSPAGRRLRAMRPGCYHGMTDQRRRLRGLSRNGRVHCESFTVPARSYAARRRFRGLRGGRRQAQCLDSLS